MATEAFAKFLHFNKRGKKREKTTLNSVKSSSAQRCDRASSAALSDPGGRGLGPKEPISEQLRGASGERTNEIAAFA